VQNNEIEEQAALRIGQIYERVQRQVYLFLPSRSCPSLLTACIDPLQPSAIAQLAALSHNAASWRRN